MLSHWVSAPKICSRQAIHKGWLQGEVELVEDLGSDRFVHLKCDHSDLVARAGRELALLQGETIGLKAMPDQIHFFQGGGRVEP